MPPSISRRCLEFACFFLFGGTAVFAVGALGCLYRDFDFELLSDFLCRDVDVELLSDFLCRDFDVELRSFSLGPAFSLWAFFSCWPGALAVFAFSGTQGVRCGGFDVELLSNSHS
jgi:hypothetical protein